MTRRSIYLEGFGHNNPIPVAARVGNLLMSSLINGTDPSTGKLADGLAAQCQFMFVQIRRTLEAAGATTDDVVRLAVWMTDRSNRGPLNAQWLAMFPDESSRPARYSLETTKLSPGVLIQCEFTAFLAS